MNLTEETVLYDDGSLQSKYSFYLDSQKKKIHHGKFKLFYPDGSLWAEGEFRHGFWYGEYRSYANGRLCIRAVDTRCGKRRIETFDEDDRIVSVEIEDNLPE